MLWHPVELIQLNIEVNCIHFFLYMCNYYVNNMLCHIMQSECSFIISAKKFKPELRYLGKYIAWLYWVKYSKRKDRFCCEFRQEKCEGKNKNSKTMGMYWVQECIHSFLLVLLLYVPALFSRIPFSSTSRSIMLQRMKRWHTKKKHQMNNGIFVLENNTICSCTRVMYAI